MDAATGWVFSREGKVTKFGEFFGEVARPFAIIWTSLCGGIAFIITALKTNDGNDGAVLLGAIGLIVTGIYLGKAWEIVKVAQAAGEK